MGFFVKKKDVFGSLHLELFLKSVENYLNLIDSMMDKKYTSQIGE